VAVRVLRSERRAYAEARYRAGSPAKALAHPGLQNQYVVPSCSPDGVPAVTATVMPHTGST